MRFLLVFIMFALHLVNASSTPEPYYRLDNYDSRYNLLDDPPAPEPKTKLLNRASMYRPARPARIKNKPDYRRIEILPPAKRAGSDRVGDYRRIHILQNRQALIRSGLPYREIRSHFLILGLNSGVDIFTTTTANTSDKRVAVEIAGRIGWLYYFSEDDYSSSMRIYFAFGAPIPTHSAIPKALNGNLNMDFLINARYLDIVVGGGYGGDYFLNERFFAHGFLLNFGISKQIGNNQLEIGVRVPFYAPYLSGARGVNHNIDIVIAYHYRI